MAEGTTEGLKNWLGGEKTARPANVGPHDPNADPQDPGAAGVRPADYHPTPGQGNNRTDAAAPGGPVNIPVKGGAPEADQDKIPQATAQGSRGASNPRE